MALSQRAIYLRPFAQIVVCADVRIVSARCRKVAVCWSYSVCVVAFMRRQELYEAYHHNIAAI